MELYTSKIGQKEFSATTRKEAYLKAIKWVANNIVSKDELSDVLVKYIRNEQFPTITVELYVSISQTEIRKRHCEICKESHAQFYINEYTNCDWCNAKGFQRRTDEMMKTKRQFYRQKISKVIGGEN